MDQPKTEAELAASALHFGQRAETNLGHMNNLAEELQRILTLAQKETSNATRQ
jgi:hypothetical protein